MKIKRLLLVGYLRLSLRSIDRFDYNPAEKTQIILGSNGSGKSSIMQELSPLPANLNEDYRKGGSKEVWIEHNGKEYHLTSKHSEEGRHYEFFCNGENLNPGRTVTVYKELVKEHFNYTPELHALVTGRVLFHELSVNDRRKLFMSMNKSDFSYAIAYFNRLKQRANELSGTINQLQKRLSAEIDGILTPEQENAVKREAEEMRGILESILIAKKTVSNDPAILERETSAIIGQFKSIQEEIELVMAKLSKHEDVRDLDVMVSNRNKLAESMASLQREFNIRCEQIAKLEKELSEVEAVDSIDIASLNGEIERLQSEKVARSSEAHQLNDGYSFPDNFDIEEAISSVSSIDRRLIGLVDTLSTYKDRPELHKVDNAKLTEANGLVWNLRELYNRARSTPDVLKSQIDQLLKDKAEGEISCPKCHHTWCNHYSDDKLKNLRLQYDSSVVTLKDYETRLAAAEKSLSEIMECAKCRSEIANLIVEHPAIDFFFRYLVREGVFAANTDRYIHEFNKFSRKLNALRDLERCDKELEQKAKIKSIYMVALDKNKDKLKAAFKDLEQTIAGIQTELRVLRNTITDLDVKIALVRELNILFQQFTVTHVEVKRHANKTIEGYLDGLLGDLISNLKSTIVYKERSVAQISMKKAVIEDTEKAIAGYKDELRIVNMAIDALSPKTGLIAQGMGQFINMYIEEVNAFIARVWSYPLSLNLVRPDDSDEIDLDYKFSVNVNNTGSSPDIARTSSGQREIIHLACVITCMRFLGFDYHPVFLDEFAVKMDEAHRKSAYDIIEYLINEAGVSQVFLISHYENGYSSLSAADITVLCDANINIPGHLSYNRVTYIN